MPRSPILFALALVITSSLQAAVRGTLITSEGRPIAGARIVQYEGESTSQRLTRLTSSNPQRVPVATAMTASDGQFTIPSAPGSTLEIHLDARGFQPSQIRVADGYEVILALDPAETRSGTITSGGKPVAGATVIWFGSDGAELLGKTSSDGRYLVPDPDRWAVSGMVLHPDFARQPISSSAGRFVLERELSRGEEIRGRVLGFSGQPLKSRIVIDGWPAGQSAEDGTFTMKAPLEWRRIEARHSSGRVSVSRSASGPYELRLNPTIAANLQVVDETSKMMIRHARVTLENNDGDRDSELVSATSPARFSLLPGTYRLTVSAPGYTFEPTTLVVGTRAVERTLVLSPTRTVVGFVFDEGGKPVPGALITPAPEKCCGGPARSRADGRFVLPGARNEKIRLKVEATGFLEGQSTLDPSLPGERPVKLQLERGFDLLGQVTDASGAPLAGAFIYVAPIEKISAVVKALRAGSAPTAKSGPQGEFTLRLRRGVHELLAQKKGYVAHHARSVTVGQQSEPLAIRLVEGASVRGRVIRVGGGGVRGVTVSTTEDRAPSASVETGSDGSFELDGLAREPTVLSFRKTEELIFETRNITPPEEVVVELPAGGTLAGYVFSKASRGPVTKFAVTITPLPLTEGSRPLMTRSFASAEGKFSIPYIRAGRHEIVVTAAGFVPVRLSPVDVTDDGTVDDIEFELDPGVVLRGGVVASDGRPIEGVQISAEPAEQRLRRPSSAEIFRSKTDAAGEFRIPAISLGEKTVIFRKSGYVSEWGTVLLEEQETALEIQLTPARQLAGVVVASDGSTLSGVTVAATSASQRADTQRATTVRDGSFLLDGMTSGRYHFELRRDDLGVTTVTKDVDVADTRPLRLVVSPGGTLLGKVTGLRPEEYPGVVITAMSAERVVSGPMGTSGSFRLQNVGKGTVKVSASFNSRTSNRTTRTESIEVREGAEHQVDLHFRSETVIAGRVIRDGSPVPNAVVHFAPFEARIETRAAASTDTLGAYQVSGLESGEYSVRVSEEGTVVFEAIHAVSTSGTFDIEIRTARIYGEVIDATTQTPIAEATISLQRAGGESIEIFAGRRAATDASGRFAIEGLAPGTYNARAEKEEFGRQLIEMSIVAGGDYEIDFKLTREPGITLRIADARDRRPLLAEVWVWDAKKRTVYQGQPKPGKEGTVRIPLTAGRYAMTIGTLGYAAKTLMIDSPATEIAILLSPGGSLILQSPSERVIKLTHATGQIYVPNFYSRTGEIALEPGSTRYDNLQSGFWTIHILDKDLRITGSRSIELLDGGISTVTLE